MGLPISRVGCLETGQLIEWAPWCRHSGYHGFVAEMRRQT